MDWIDGQPAAVAGLTFLYGFASALFPVLNIEVVALALPITQPNWWLLSVLSMAAGQTVGKIVIFQAARHGSQWLDRWKPRNRQRDSRGGPTWWRRFVEWSNNLFRLLDDTWPAGGVVLLSATVGLPPLAVVSAVAGTRRTPLWIFVAAVAIGRSLRLLILAVPVAMASG